MTTRARSFDTAAASYAAHRPGYPPALLDAVEELTGRPLAGARVADIGAGTGIATALLHRRGADVVAVEPGDGMAAQLRLAHPRIPVLRGDGNRLPLVTGAFDLLTYAQAWHWTDPARSVPEARRVLRPGGALAIWWNDSDTTVPWIAEQEARLAEFFEAKADPAKEAGPSRQTGQGSGFRTLPRGLGGFATRSVRWSRRVPLDAHLANLASHSAFLMLGEAGTRAYLAAERELLAPHFPDGTVEESYVVSLHVARV
ncbi:class I SAM-dependent methyltransferase [Streptomyces sp. TN58]|uniref:class I SAM-dependent methyltransferase n=1 Tax=Streptomyces sp. TN58 TaxID=234612 RepID=UPI000950848D|nr:class I SAM-dependent methyltransferase [Streptomyces sp. TN58]APU39853.1 SAM-dependent methyltransferase [Streptomyces sp. TN58]